MANSSDDKTEAEQTSQTVEETTEVEIEEPLQETGGEDEPISEDPQDTPDEPLNDEVEPFDETEPVEVVEPAPAAEKRSGGFFPLLLGGVAAAAIGYGFALYGPFAPTDNSEELQAQLEAQESRISELAEALAAIPAEPDLSRVEAQFAVVDEQLGSVADASVQRAMELEERIFELEKAPNSDGTLSDTALAAYQQELEDLRAELDAQKDAVMSAAAQAEADLAAARAEAERLEEEAVATAEAASVRAALNRIAAAVETGSPFGDALSSLPEDAVPPVLAAASIAGVATTAQLVDEFPDAARAALSTARNEGLSEDVGGVGGFFRNQLNMRSSTPQEGDGPDAVLSRAEAALKEGRVADALAELEALPEVAGAEMTDWTALAQERSDVLDAIASLFETYN